MFVPSAALSEMESASSRRGSLKVSVIAAGASVTTEPSAGFEDTSPE
jgi:hypothetical protein